MEYTQSAEYELMLCELVTQLIFLEEYINLTKERSIMTKYECTLKPDTGEGCEEDRFTL